VSWFRVHGERLVYRGRITRDPFTKWAATKVGLETVAREAGSLRFRLFGHQRARRRLWRALDAASRTDAVAAAISLEADYYMQVLADVCYTTALPRAHIALHRLVLAPRAMIAGRADAGALERLSRVPALAGLDTTVRAFLLHHLVIEMDAALRKASPSPRHPVHAPDGWACVGISIGTVWMDRIFAGPDATGHVFMYEFPRERLSRRDRKALEAAIEQMAASAATLSRAERFAVMRAASLQ
jgi:hypothetical protein